MEKRKKILEKVSAMAKTNSSVNQIILNLQQDPANDLMKDTLRKQINEMMIQIESMKDEELKTTPKTNGLLDVLNRYQEDLLILLKNL